MVSKTTLFSPFTIAQVILLQPLYLGSNDGCKLKGLNLDRDKIFSGILYL